MRSYTLLAIALAASTPARADFFLHHWEDFFHEERGALLDFDLSYYATTADYDANGALLAPADLLSYHRFQSDVSGSWSVHPNINLFGRFSWARIELGSVARPGAAFGPTDQSIGAAWRILESKDKDKLAGTSIIVQAQVDLPMYSNANAEANLTPYMGDGTIDVTAGAFLELPVYQTRVRAMYLKAGAGYTYRTAGFSQAVPWSAGFDYAPRSGGITGSLFALGVQSLKSDVNSVGVTSATALSRGTAGSFITNAINPTQINVRAQLGYQLTPEFELHGFGTKSIFGQAAPEQVQFGLTLVARLGPARQRDSVHQSASEYGRSNKGFVNYSLEARIVRASDRLNLVKIDKGGQDGVEVGQVFDIFSVKADGSIGEAVARAKVSSIKNDEAALSISEYYKEVWIEEGFVAKRPIQ